MFPEGLEGGLPDMSALLEQAQKMQEQLVAAKDQLASETVSGSAASGLVSATVTGTGDLVSLDIKPAAVDEVTPESLETLGDMIVAAIRDANERANALAAERMAPLAGGFGDSGAAGSLGF